LTLKKRINDLDKAGIKKINNYNLKYPRSKIFCFIIGTLIPFVMVVHWINLAKRKSAIEKLEIVLNDIKKKIPGNSKISLLTNLKEPSPYAELYYQTQFIMCPAIVMQNDQDTILLVEQADKDPLKPENMEVISVSEQGNFRVHLLKKK